MLIKDIMTTRLVTVHMDDTLAQVKSLFEKHNFHHLLVVDKSRLMGVLSDRDLFKSISPNIGTVSESVKDIACLNKRAHQIMSRELVTLAPDSGLLRAITVFNRNRVSCIPVVDKYMKPLGIVSWRDVFKYVETKQVEKYFANKGN